MPIPLPFVDLWLTLERNRRVIGPRLLDPTTLSGVSEPDSLEKPGKDLRLSTNRNRQVVPPFRSPCPRRRRRRPRHHRASQRRRKPSSRRPRPRPRPPSPPPRPGSCNSPRPPPIASSERNDNHARS